MILVDSSVWIDFFRGNTTAEVDLLDDLLGRERIAVGDLIMVEVLQGFRTTRHFNQARKTLATFDLVELGGFDIALKAARNFRVLQTLGHTVRKTIDTIIATRCIEAGYVLLHSDRDFDPFAKHLGLQVALREA